VFERWALGIFDVNMPLIYGEGSRALLRLQMELLKRSDDASIFAFEEAWSESRDPLCVSGQPLAPLDQNSDAYPDPEFGIVGLFASSPKAFLGSSVFRSCRATLERTNFPSVGLSWDDIKIIHKIYFLVFARPKRDGSGAAFGPLNTVGEGSPGGLGGGCRDTTGVFPALEITRSATLDGQ
jgi:hypothetical protein